MSSCKDDVPRDQIKAALYPIPQRAGSSTENRPSTRTGDQDKMRKTRGAATDSVTHYTLLDTGVDRIHGLAVAARGCASWHPTSQQCRAKTREGAICGSWLVPTAQESNIPVQSTKCRLIQPDSSHPSFVMNPPTTPMFSARNFSTWIHPPPLQMLLPLRWIRV